MYAVRTFWRQILTIAVITAALLLPAALNGLPFFLQDTDSYWNSGRAVAELFNSESKDPSQVVSAHQTAQPAISRRPKQDNAVIGGRSVYFGAVIFVGQLAVGWWGLAVFQSLIFGWVLMVWFRVHETPVFIVAITTATIILSGAGFVTTFLMPDYLAGITILATAILVSFRKRLARIEQVLLSTVAIFGVTSHISIVAIEFLLAAFLLFIALTFKRYFLSKALIPVAIVMIGILSIFAFNEAVSMKFGKPPIYPPFLLARFVGTGAALPTISRLCRANVVETICKYQKNFPVTSDEFLWSRDAGVGTFGIATTPERRALAAEQSIIVTAMIRDDPMPTIISIITGTATQMVSFRLDFHEDIRVWPGYMAIFWPDVYQEWQKTRQASAAFPWKTLVAVQSVIIVLSVIALVLLLIKRTSSDTWLTVSIIFVGIISNALICGALSTPIDRYQARVIWLLPLLVGYLYRHSSIAEAKLSSKQLLMSKRPIF